MVRPFHLSWLLCTALLFSFALGSAPAHGQDAPFVTVWDTQIDGESDNDQIIIPGTGTDYTIEWEEVGNPTNDSSGTGSGTHTITFPSPGTYRVKITGNFTRIRFGLGSAEGGDRDKIISVEQWGDIEWDTMESAFGRARNLEISADDTPNLSSVSSMRRMFRAAESITGENSNMESWNTSNVTNMSRLFEQAESFNYDISGWDVSNVENMDNMFSSAKEFNQDIGDWDISSVKVMSGMFSGASSFNGDITSWNTGNVESMVNMFRGASSFNRNINGWDVSSVTNMTRMFDEASDFNQSLGAWDISGVEDTETFPNSFQDIFTGSALSSENYDRTLTGWAGQRLNSGLGFGAGGIEYCNSGPFRQHLMQAFNLSIEDSGQKDGCPNVLKSSQARQVDGDGTFEFGDVATTMTFDGVIGSGRVTLGLLANEARNIEGISEANVSQYRLVIAGGGISFFETVELRFDVEGFVGIDDPTDLVVYSRSRPGNGAFEALSTTFDESTGEIVVETDGLGELVFASDTNPLAPRVINVGIGTLDFGTVAIRDTVVETITISSDGEAPLEGIAELTGEETPYSIGAGQGEFSLEPGKNLDVEVRYAPEKVSNPDLDTLEITHNGDSTSSPVKVPIEGGAEAPQIATEPTPLEFGPVPVDSTERDTVAIRNEATEVADLRVDSTTLKREGSLFTIAAGDEGAIVEPDDETSVVLEYTPEVESTQDTDTLDVFHNDPNVEDPLAVPIIASAEAPQIAASLTPSDTTVRSGQTAELTHTVENEATEVAQLEVRITSVPDFLTLENVEGGTFNSSDSTLTLNPGAESVLTYSFEETVDSTTTFEGKIAQETNDPDATTVELPVSITAEAAQIALAPSQIEFDVTAIAGARGGEAAPTDTFEIKNTNGATLTVESVAVAENSSPFAVSEVPEMPFEVEGGDSQPIEVTYDPSEPTPEGEPDTAAVAIESDADNVEGPVEVGLEGASEAPQITASLAPQETTIGSGETATFTQSVANNATEVAQLEVKITGVPDFLTLEGAEGGTFNASDSTLTLNPGAESALTYSFEETVESTTTFEGEISHETNDPGTPTIDLSAAVTVQPAGLAVEITQSFGSASRPEDYRLVALPGRVDRPLESTIGGDAGTAWQAFWDDGSDEDFLIKFDGSDTFRFRPGRGFWMTATEEWSVQDSVTTVSLEGGQATSVPLHEGWNVVSNPLGSNVPWDAVDQANGGNLQPAWTFTGSFARADTFRSARTGQAYYFLNDGGLDSLSIPVTGSSESGQSALTAETSGSEEKKSSPETMRLVARQGDSLRSSVQVGVAAKGSENAAAEDIVAPPARFSELSLRLLASSDVLARRQFLATEYRNPDSGTEGGHTFDLQLKNETGETVQVSASNIQAITGREAFLIEEGTGRSHDLRARRSVTIEVADSTAFRLAIGTEEYVENEREAILPDEVSLTTYPNPMREQATLEYTLPEATDVRITVYDVLGRQVALLENGRKEAGRHTVGFSGERLSSGVYFGRLKTGNQTRTQKITVVR